MWLVVLITVSLLAVIVTEIVRDQIGQRGIDGWRMEALVVVQVLFAMVFIGGVLFGAQAVIRGGRMTEETAIIGPHIIGQVTPHLPLLQRWQPRLVTVIDPNPDEMQRLYDTCPNTTVVGRIYVPDAEMRERIMRNPKEAAEFANGKVLEIKSDAVDYWQIANEICQQWDEIDKLVEFEVHRMHLSSQYGYSCAIFGFSVGNPDMPEHNRMAVWERCYPAMRMAVRADHCVALHQYGWPSFWDLAPDWYVHRLEHEVLHRLSREFDNLEFAVTEFGVDGLLKNPYPSGWKMGPLTAKKYVQDLTDIGQYLEEYYPRVLGYSVFTLGHSAPYSSYDIVGDVSEQLASFYEERRNTTPVIPSTRTVEAPVTTVVWGSIARMSDGAKKLGLTMATPPLGSTRYRLVDIFTTQNGSWELDEDDPYGVPDWARDKYLKHGYGTPEYFDDAGANHHLFARVENVDGVPIALDVKFANDIEVLSVRNTGEKTSGWTNIPIWSSFNPDIEQGPWKWGMTDGEWVKGGGLPLNHHVSSFAVWREVASVPEPEPTGYSVNIPLILNKPAMTITQPPEGVPLSEWFMQTMARIFGLELEKLKALQKVEAAGDSFEDGRMIIRFENHIFARKLANDDLYAKSFSHNDEYPWLSHEYRNASGEWRVLHVGNQNTEWEAFEIAKKMDRYAALQAIAMGSGQVMGFNYADVGYLTPQLMFDDLRNPVMGEVNQIAAMMAYLVSSGALEALRQKDWEDVALRYNGSGNVTVYATALRQAYKELKELVA